MAIQNKRQILFKIVLGVLFLITSGMNSLFGIVVTVQLRDSQANLIDQGTVQYYSGGWQDFGVTSGGEVTKDLPPGNYKFRMTYADGSNERYKDIGIDSIVVFQTVNARVQLMNSQFALIDTGEVQYYSGGWHALGITSNGETAMELLPNNYKFRVTYAFASNEKYQDLGSDPIVVFQTVSAAVQLKDSGLNLIDAGTVQYYSGGWREFGSTVGGEVKKELLPNNYKFRMTYAYASNEKYQDIDNDAIVIFQTVNVRVQLKDSALSPLDTGVVQYYAGGWRDFNTTQNGEAVLELLPNNYKFRMTYAFASNEKYQQIADDPVVVFQTVKSEVRLHDSDGRLIDEGSVKYYAGGWRDFGTTSAGVTYKELLPNNYKFRMTYAYASNEKYQQIGDDPIVVFQTVGSQVLLKDSENLLMDPGTVKYYAGGWRDYGLTSGGSVDKELLPNNYKFRMTYAFASNEKYQHIGEDSTVVFQTVLGVVHVNDALDNPVSGAVVTYYSGGWRDFGTTTAGQVSKELLPKNYKFRITYGDEKIEMYQDLSAAPDVQFQLADTVATGLTLTLTSPTDGLTTSDEMIFVSGTTEDPDALVSINGQSATVCRDGSFSEIVSLNAGNNVISVTATSPQGSASETRTVTYTPPILPPDPINVAPPVDQTVVTIVSEATKFLYTGDNPIQTGVDTADISLKRAAVLRGNILKFNGDPLPGVEVTILNHPEFGQTLSRTDGWYDMVVNGGGHLTVKYEKAGYFPAQRNVYVPWQDYVVIDSIAMVQIDPNVTAIDFSEPIQVARGSVTTDEDGSRQATVLFKQGTQAEMVLPDNSVVPLSSLHFRATEYTVGDMGPAAMPAELPPQSAYTYCVELSCDEAIQAGADQVRFSQPVPFYVENFLGFPAGTPVPVGFYDRKLGAWVPSDNGRVIDIVGISNGLAEIDIDGDSAADPPDSLTVIGITSHEQEELALLYVPGQSLWRAEMNHFTPCDLNWAYGPPDDAVYPNQPEPEVDDDIEDDQCTLEGSIIGIQHQTLGQSMPITGTRMNLLYQSDRTLGRSPEIDIPLSGPTIPASLKRIELFIFIAGRSFKYSYAPQTNLSQCFVWDRKDYCGRLLSGKQRMNITINYVYDEEYAVGKEILRIFGKPGWRIESGVNARLELNYKQYSSVEINSWVESKENLGNWRLSLHHIYDPVKRILYMGNGSRRSAENIAPFIVNTLLEVYQDLEPTHVFAGSDGTLYIVCWGNHMIYRMSPDSVLTVLAGTGEPGYSGDGGLAINAKLQFPCDVVIGVDGNVYFTDSGNHCVRKIDSNGIITTVAGTGEFGYSGDNGPANEARLAWPLGLAISPTGVLFVADFVNLRIRTIDCDGIITTYAGDIDDFVFATDIAIGPDGSVIFANPVDCIVQAITPDGEIRTVAGDYDPGYSGDGGKAINALLNLPLSVDIGPDGQYYIADVGNYRIRTVTLDNIINTIAGSGETINIYDIYNNDFWDLADFTMYYNSGYTFFEIFDIDLPDYDYYDFYVDFFGEGDISEILHTALFSIDTSGIDLSGMDIREAFNFFITAIDISEFFELCSDACNEHLSSIFFEEFVKNVFQIYNIDMPEFEFPRTEISPVTVSEILEYLSVDTSQFDIPNIDISGMNVYEVFDTLTVGIKFDLLLEWYISYIVPFLAAEKGFQEIDFQGIFTSTVTDAFYSEVSNQFVAKLFEPYHSYCQQFSGEGTFATTAKLTAGGLAVLPDGSVCFADPCNQRVRKITVPFSEYGSEEITLASEDGSEVYVFNRQGKHLRTLDALFGYVKYRFNYDTEGRLIGVSDMYDMETTIERDGSGCATGLRSPFGQTTTLNYDGNGCLSDITNPAGENTHFVYQDNGLMTEMSDPMGGLHTFTYDTLGRLIADRDPVGAEKFLQRSSWQGGYETTVTTAEGRERSYDVEKLLDGTKRLVNVSEGGQTTVPLIAPNGTTTTSLPNGSEVKKLLSPDPRYGLESPVVKQQSLTMPSGLESTFGRSRTITQMSGLTVTGMRDTITVNGKHTVREFDGINRISVTTSPEGRKSYVFMDEFGRTVKDSIPGMTAVHYAYDNKGFLIETRQGNRTTSFVYNDQGMMETVTDPLNRTTTTEYDSVGRVMKKIFPDNREVLYTYDDNGNMTSLTPPGRPAHSFTYTPMNRTESYIPPATPDSAGATYYEYNLDGQLVKTILPNGDSIKVVYDTSDCECSWTGKPSSVVFDRGEMVFEYDSSTANLMRIITPESDSLGFTYDGSLLTSMTSFGTVNGSVEFLYDNDFRVIEQRVNGSNPVSYLYNNDGLLTQTGDLSISYNTENGLMTGTSLGNVTTEYTYNDYGEVSGYTAKFDSGVLFQTVYTHDDLGRITQIIETVQGVTKTFDYSYDLAGRLVQVDRNDTTISVYTYDDNGNRLSHETLDGTVFGTYDDQDRMLSYGNASYGYDANGTLEWKAENSDTTRYTYDNLGNLISVLLPDGKLVEYVIDGKNRRIGKKVDGVFEYRLIYEDKINPVAMLDASGQVIARFVYGSKSNSPEYILTNGNVYRIISDHIGSTRIVINVLNGEVLQSVFYDEYGKILENTNLCIQPFLYAGGFYDNETKLVYYHTRNYDASSGRWTEKDPIKFDSGRSNFYEYSLNNPINYSDPLGLTVSCTYSQGTGHLVCYDDYTNNEVVNEYGYSGRGEGKNNPLMEHVKDVGPIPRGLWSIGPAYDSDKCGAVTIPLDASFGTETYGRSDFRIHGDDGFGTASEGCIVMSLDVRNIIDNSGGGTIEVYVSPLWPWSDL